MIVALAEAAAAWWWTVAPLGFVGDAFEEGDWDTTEPERFPGVQFNWHFEFWAQNWAPNWATF